MAKNDSTHGDDNKMVVYVDELGEDFLDVASDDESDQSSIDGDHSDDDEGLDLTDAFLPKKNPRSTYDLNDDGTNQPKPAVTVVSIKNKSSTFSTFDKGFF